VSSFKLLTANNPKIVKGQKRGFLTFILHLAPARLSGFQTCPMATKGCSAACLNTAGRGGMFKVGESTNTIQQARIRKTQRFFTDRAAFMAELVGEVDKAIRYAVAQGLTPTFRLNGTSDIRWETVPVTYMGQQFPNIMSAFRTVQFYDYTKIPNRRVSHIRNYHLTFSLADGNEQDAERALQCGTNVAVVFRHGPAPVKVEKSLAQQLADKAKREAKRERNAGKPRTSRASRSRTIDMSWLPQSFMGFAVVNGDESDLRFLDAPVKWYHKLFGVRPKPVIVAVKAKGKALYDVSGFVKNA
jgi:hypothetical protein